MLLLSTLFLVLLEGAFVSGIDLNSFRPRQNCYSEEQQGCNEEFIDKYKNLSTSATTLTPADTYFWMFTRRNPENPDKLHKCAGRLPPSSNFNPQNRLIVIIIPFLAGFCDIAVYREWKKFILEREDCNILVVDYTWGNNLDVSTAVKTNYIIVANQTEIVLRNIQEQTGIKAEQMYLIGHSLGAQIAGFIGYLFNGKIGRITGLDPAGPGYRKELTSPKYRLDPNDAYLVDVWHTNTGKCLPDMGIDYDAGDIDFYINGGHYQPSCYSYGLKSVLRGDILYGINMVTPSFCSHTHCAQYFKVSINPGNCQFIARKCKSYRKFKSGRCNECGKYGQNCIIMGYDTDKYFKKYSRFPQKYYIDTSPECPYCDNSKIELQGFLHTYRSSLRTTSNRNGTCV